MIFTWRAKFPHLVRSPVVMTFTTAAAALIVALTQDVLIAAPRLGLVLLARSLGRSRTCSCSVRGNLHTCCCDGAHWHCNKKECQNHCFYHGHHYDRHPGKQDSR